MKPFPSRRLDEVRDGVPNKAYKRTATSLKSNISRLQARHLRVVLFIIGGVFVLMGYRRQLTVNVPTSVVTPRPNDWKSAQQQKKASYEGFMALHEKLAVANHFKLCRSATLPPPWNFTAVGTSCQGPGYEAFSAELLRQAVNQSNHNPLWGRRTIPPNSTMLLVGSKFVNKVAMTAACQAGIHSMRISRDQLVTRFHFTNDAILWVVADSYFPYSSDWKNLLEMQLSQAFLGTAAVRLADMDAVVVGLFQQCSEADTTKFTARMQQWSEKIEGVNCFIHQSPSMTEWTQAYDGPIALLTLPTDDRNIAAQQAASELEKQIASRGRLGVIPARRFINTLDETCPVRCNGGSTRRPCVGDFGGFVDLMVWDVVEFLYSHVEGVTKADEHNVSKKQQLWWPMPVPEPPACPTDTMALWPERRHCTHKHIAAPSDVLSVPVPVTYWCEGDLYNGFGEQLRNYPSPAESWGRRQVPVPAGTRVLFLGNSHTRQVAYGILCLYQDLLEHVQELHFHGAIRYDFCYDSTKIATLFNSHVPYSHNWRALLEEEVGEPLSNFDAVVLGQMNRCGGPNSFSKDMEALTETMPDVDCMNISPPSVLEWADAFDGAIIFVSMFSTNQLDESEAARKDIQALQRSNVVFVDARQHIDKIQNECASFNRKGVSDCVWDFDNADMYNSTHRCVGEHGGHPDLVGWDVVEHLHGLLG